MASVELQFRAALQDYETKNYKKAIQSIDKILKKNPTHSQSYALKALITGFYHPNQPDFTNVNSLCNVRPEVLKECEELVETAMKYGPSNSISAHLSALYYRHIKNYAQAAHYYSISYANNPNNKAILRDLSTCLSQSRKYKLLCKTRLDYLTAEPGYRANYSSTAVAYDINGDYGAAIKIIDQVEDLIKDKLVDDDIHENSESYIYKVELFTKSEEYQQALDLINALLERTDKFTCHDIFGLLEIKYQTLMKLDQLKEAQLVIRQLLKKNPDNIKYYQDLVKCLGIEGNSELKTKLFNKLASFYPKSDLPKFLPLTYLKDVEFENHLTSYLSGLFKRGVPSAFSSVRSLYKDAAKADIALKIAQDFESKEEDDVIKSWIKYFISQHYYKLKDYDMSMKKINESIELITKPVEFLAFKARILKHQNKLLEAADVMNSARLIDLQDRFINSKSVKYNFRANKIDEALELASLFTKNDEEDTPIKDFHVVQACWVISEYAEALDRTFRSKLAHYKEIENVDQSLVADEERENVHLLKKQIETYFGLALQRYYSIFNIFAEYFDDQFDFHFYAFRKGNIRAYNETLQWADNLYKQPFLGRIYSDMLELISYATEEKELLGRAFDYSTTLTKRNKKDKKDEARWKDHMLKLHQVYESDIFGESLVKDVLKGNFGKIEELENIVSNNKPDLVSFLNGSFNYDMLHGKYVVSLAVLRKVREISKQESETGEKAGVVAAKMLEKINTFIETPTEDAKVESLKKIVKLGLMRL